MPGKEQQATRTVTVRIDGRVQGVYYRAWTYETAQSLGLDGTVRNMSDGSVEAAAAAAGVQRVELDGEGRLLRILARDAVQLLSITTKSCYEPE